MNMQDRAPDAPAQLHYGDGDFVVLKPGRWVACAVSGRRIPLEALRYWSSARQEPYWSAAEAAAAARQHGFIV
jgi:hypothetical protein